MNIFAWIIWYRPNQAFLSVFDLLKYIQSLSVVTDWWRRWESNPLPLECHSSALPSELRPHWDFFPRNNPWKLNNEKSFSTFWVLAEIRDASLNASHFLHRKEVIQPHLPIRLPCYDLTPIIEPTFDCCLLAVSSQASGVPNFHGLTGGVYKARERIHRDMLIRDY